MPPKRKAGMPPVNPNRRPKIAGSARSLNVPTGTSGTEPVEAEAIEKTSPSVETPAEVTPTVEATPTVEVPKTSLKKSQAPQPAESTQDEVSADAPSEPQAGEAVAETTESSVAEHSSRSQWGLVAGVGAAAVVVAVFAGLAFFKVGVQMDDVAWVDEGATAEVLRITPPALEAVFTFAPDTFDADFDKGVQGLNQAMRDQLTQYKDTQKAGVEQTQTATTADVTEIGITRLEEDRAQLLAQLNVSSTQSGVAAGSRSGMVVVSLEKQDGNWLISEIKDR
ncbi:hypothetical protein B2J88_06555 [Rhodococcus sp. SRB_17]|uniref:hypothetical protein n=1 Tax=Rhodococcus sp. OK302 TaxID=1882769 RepID=UPI000B94062C|nr:hypothetical protein [Rhodococcus sp. OK302]NMM84018.1 hypothetical protein [Rhodococcus sp. SRB_17]OYD68837.1 Mce-associated membrane protein [Rhodococcus sp. OK302]